ncbi:DUF881 domain-containing protein [Lolliginicoccus suaedae]|uniref:DUF881 domain-containing protein n=1 Tax=Lolliginicoccus suaedae TaxID=2605429 RepID=UPI0011EE13BF|nr:DUF881 domain-containing protein [Lolliginicoccus suaedae]
MRGTRTRDLQQSAPWRWSVPVVCLVAGLMLATTHQSSRGEDSRDTGPSRLSSLVREAESSSAETSQRAESLAAEIARRQSTIGTTDARVAATLESLSALAASSNRGPVEGEGVTVTLTDASRDQQGNYPSEAAPDDLVVHQQDLQSVINALWAGGAIAIQVQDQRITTLSAPRCIGNTLLLHGRAYSPPYVITAIGEPEDLVEELDDAPGVRLYRQYAARYGLGYEVVEHEEIAVAAAGDAPRLKHSAPLE